jgi:hypothetical protein
MALVAITRGERVEGEARQRTALATFASVDARCQVARSRLALAQALISWGASAEARAELSAARGAFRTMGAP